MKGTGKSTGSRDYGRKITLLRKQRGISQKELAAKSGVPLTAVRRCEQKGQIPLQRYLAMTSALGAVVDVSPARTPFTSIDTAPPKSRAGTLAQKLGIMPHLSPLLRKLKKHGLKTPEEMVACAIGRGCSHYANMPNWKDIQALPAPEISDEELSIGLLSPCHPYEPLFIRAGCQLLSTPLSNPKTLARLAGMERCVPTLEYIATCGKETEPDNPFWTTLLESLPITEHPHPEFPKTSIHISRFRAETGITNPFKTNMQKTLWLRPKSNP